MTVVISDTLIVHVTYLLTTDRYGPIITVGGVGGDFSHTRLFLTHAVDLNIYEFLDERRKAASFVAKPSSSASPSDD